MHATPVHCTRTPSSRLAAAAIGVGRGGGAAGAAQPQLPRARPGRQADCSVGSVPRRTVAAAATPPQPSPAAAYLASVAAVPVPPHLDSLVRLLTAQGLAPTSPGARAGLHPLVIPLAAGPAATQLTGWVPVANVPLLSATPLPGSPPHPSSTTPPAIVVGLLRWAAAPDAAAERGLPVVLTAPGSPRVTLLARSAAEYVHRALAEEDGAAGASGGGGGGGGAPGSAGSLLPFAAAVGPEGSPYPAGDVPAGTPPGSPHFDAHLVRRVGAFPDVAERLITRHLAKPDTMSALITGEWYSRKGSFPGWGRPYEAVARVYASLGRGEEARDAARAALGLPWWGLEHGFAACAALAQLPPTPAGVRGALAAAEQGAGGVPVSARTDPQVALEAAGAALDDVAGGGAGEGTLVDWGAAIEPVAAALERAGLGEAAAFVRAAEKGGGAE